MLSLKIAPYQLFRIRLALNTRHVYAAVTLFYEVWTCPVWYDFPEWLSAQALKD